MLHAETKLQELLGAQYKATNWKAAFNAIFEAEDNQGAAIAAVEKLQDTALKMNRRTNDNSVHTSHFLLQLNPSC